jgi:hypothetical protein
MIPILSVLTLITLPWLSQPTPKCVPSPNPGPAMTRVLGITGFPGASAIAIPAHLPTSRSRHNPLRSTTQLQFTIQNT